MPTLFNQPELDSPKIGTPEANAAMKGAALQQCFQIKNWTDIEKRTRKTKSHQAMQTNRTYV